MKKAEGRRENYLWIVFDKPLRVYKPQTIFSTPVDGGVLNPQSKRKDKIQVEFNPI
ncbi:MAG: hypothetical protein F6K39_10465 [Okeania sp. SIO3B3]|nr:hypothetical protein [Okeania sp. SIO3B3]